MTAETESRVLFAYHYSGKKAAGDKPAKMTMTEKLHGKKPAKVFHTNEVKHGQEE